MQTMYQFVKYFGKRLNRLPNAIRLVVKCKSKVQDRTLLYVGPLLVIKKLREVFM